jgi:hypothetical protein
MDLIFNILGAAALGHLGADFLNRYEWLPQKPFKCNMCLSFWLSITPFIFLYSGYGIWYAALSGIISELYFKYL